MLISNARVVTRDDTFVGTVHVEHGMIRSVSHGTTLAREAQDWHGDYLLPGLVELHTDNLEKHLLPRPGVQWDTDAAFVVHDAQVAAAGITTVFDALAIGTRENVGVRGREAQVQCAQAIERFANAGLLRAEHFLHLRCEVATEDVVEIFDALSPHPRLRLASVMDHTPGQRQWQDPEQWRLYQERQTKWTDEEAAATLAELTDEQQRYAERHRAAIVARCAALGVPVASHDDALVEHVVQAAAEGVAMSEFPTTLEAAQAAKAHGIAVVMGAPNVVRGGSHSGNVSALALARAGLLDILSSDYVPSSLICAAFDLVREAGWSLPRALDTVSFEPARQAGLDDRGQITPGLRADFVRVAMHGTLPVPRETYVAGRRVV